MILTREEIHTLVSQHAMPRLVEVAEAIVQVESGGNPFAWNPEPAYRYVWDVKRNIPFKLGEDIVRSPVPPKDFPTLAGDQDQEWWGQRASWGLMQVMGAVARELGYREPYLPELCLPDTNIQYGCLHLKALHRLYAGKFGLMGVVAAYNAGSPRLLRNGKFENQRYVDKVFRLFM